MKLKELTGEKDSHRWAIVRAYLFISYYLYGQENNYTKEHPNGYSHAVGSTRKTSILIIEHAFAEAFMAGSTFLSPHSNMKIPGKWGFLCLAGGQRGTLLDQFDGGCTPLSVILILDPVKYLRWNVLRK